MKKSVKAIPHQWVINNDFVIIDDRDSNFEFVNGMSPMWCKIRMGMDNKKYICFKNDIYYFEEDMI